MESKQIEGHIYGIKEYENAVEITLAIPNKPLTPKSFDGVPKEEQVIKQREYVKSPAYLKAKAEIEKKVASLHLSKVTLTQDQ